MSGTTILPTKRHGDLHPIAVMAVFVVMAVWLLPGYIPWTSVNFLLGLAGLPLAISGAPNA